MARRSSCTEQKTIWVMMMNPEVKAFSPSDEELKEVKRICLQIAKIIEPLSTEKKALTLYLLMESFYESYGIDIRKSSIDWKKKG